MHRVREAAADKDKHPLRKPRFQLLGSGWEGCFVWFVSSSCSFPEAETRKKPSKKWALWLWGQHQRLSSECVWHSHSWETTTLALLWRAKHCWLHGSHSLPWSLFPLLHRPFFSRRHCVSLSLIPRLLLLHILDLRLGLVLLVLALSNLVECLSCLSSLCSLSSLSSPPSNPRAPSRASAVGEDVSRARCSSPATASALLFGCCLPLLGSFLHSPLTPPLSTRLGLGDSLPSRILLLGAAFFCLPLPLRVRIWFRPSI